ncbi:EAL domain-containing protein [Acetobacter orleanensis]|uniref:EAL domain-containing protein n=1 Tax=Acetobacter orleanensis TaxID=104099 RepID=A0A4Y3THG3_9PROT|nr:EAL domain-containing protein [Acetobacter orleanensis]PCD80366.1 EAL domain-containing protein [Acetobacter orleanensis]GAN68876.1 diguanylate cyclase/phosphodiesterase [Acetobacter orleanensis JCM 7639]GBR30880.1 diguanylate cyclase [Acetobacter orleanensis NRIC 0473]GEB81716.1 hypothetical protein AOR01nite_01930 [Acetobacter orleanensis]
MPFSDPATQHGQKHEAQLPPVHHFGWQALEHALTQILLAAEGSTAPHPVVLLRVDLLRSTIPDAGTDWPMVSTLADHALNLLLAALPAGTGSFSPFATQLALVVTPQTDDATVESVLENIVATAETCLTGGLDIDGIPFSFDALIGAAAFPADGNSARSLITAANAALFAAQFKGISSRTATAGKTRQYTAHIQTDHALRRAILHEDLQLEFLPIMESTSELIIGFEARPLWVPPENIENTLPIPVSMSHAARLGLIEPLNIWTLKNACFQALTWSQPLGVSVSISPIWLGQERLSETLRGLLAESGLPAQRLQLELSERHYFSAPEIARKELARVRAMGVRLAMDKFGTGYSSLERLKHYPFDQVKLDSTFTHNILEDWRAQALLRSILHLVSSLDMRCCATGVETQEQFAFLAVNGCHEIQGKVAGPSIETC